MAAPNDLPAGCFAFGIRTRIESGPGILARLPAVAREVVRPETVADHDVLLVTDPGVHEAGHAERAAGLLREAGFDTTVFADTHENPTEEDVERLAAVAREERPSLLVAVGGGSAIDTAKGCAFLLAGGGRMEDYWGVGKAKGALLPLIAVPTTAGTGSEVQSFALIGKAGSHAKMACGDPQAAPRVALLDPELTRTMPTFVTVCTALDTMVHAVETAVTRVANRMTFPFSARAFADVCSSLPAVLQDPRDLGARESLMVAAASAGIAIENSMLGAAHSMANPLTAHHDVPHGVAVALCLPHVVRFNAREPRVAEAYARLARDAGVVAPDTPPSVAVEELVETVRHLVDSGLRAADAPRTLGGFGVPAGAGRALADEAAAQWTAGFNPVPVGVEAFRELYGHALGDGQPL